jgi:hypothetical protein
LVFEVLLDIFVFIFFIAATGFASMTSTEAHPARFRSLAAGAGELHPGSIIFILFFQEFTVLIFKELFDERVSWSLKSHIFNFSAKNNIFKTY